MGYTLRMGLKPALSLKSCVIWGKMLNLHEPLFPHTKISMWEVYSGECLGLVPMEEGKKVGLDRGRGRTTPYCLQSSGVVPSWGEGSRALKPYIHHLLDVGFDLR